MERGLRIFARVEPREGSTALLLMVNVFLILTAYYIIKPVREGWIAVSVISGLTSLEIKAYSAFGQSLLLFAVLPVYSWLATRWPRRVLITRVGLVFAALLIAFWALQPDLLFSVVPFSGVAFYLFVGIFSVTLVAQFWSFATDLYGEDKGKRLFPLVAIGASAGAVAGSWLGETILRHSGIGAFDLMLVGILPLVLALGLATLIDRRGTLGRASQATQKRWVEPAAPSGEGAFKLIRGHKYLSATAALTLTFSWVVASGDNILFGFVQESVRNEFGEISNEQAYRNFINTATTAFYGNFYFWVNLIGLLLQAFIVSRVLRYVGFGALLLTTPVISLAAYASMLATPLLAVVKAVKIVENASNYSVNNTSRHMLWLPATKEMLYQAKPTIDTLFVRLGDGLAALTILLGTRVWQFSISDFVLINLLLVLGWLVLAVYLIREHRRFTPTGS